MTGKPNDADEFQREATGPRTGLVREFWDFLKHNKKWWLLPILIVLLLLGLLVFLSASGLAPLLYTVF